MLAMQIHKPLHKWRSLRLVLFAAVVLVANGTSMALLSAMAAQLVAILLAIGCVEVSHKMPQNACMPALSVC